MDNTLLQRITINPDICHGKPCIRGLRYPVEFILELLSSGMSIEDILIDYDDLERDDILAVLAFAAKLSEIKSISLSNYMKFLIDAQLPVSLARSLQANGYDTVHTRDLPLQNATSDAEINVLSLRENRIVVTKDKDFLNSFLLSREPYKLLLITTGNITNQDLESLFFKNLPQLVALFDQYEFIEMSRNTIIVHV